MKKLFAWVAVIAAGAGTYYWLSQKPTDAANASEITMPALSVLAAEGKPVFDGTCAACHGVNLLGTNEGPPLLHAFYKPGHHGDGAFVNAIQNGSVRHHWPFGDMPPQPHITGDQIVRIITYVREVQRANGFE